MAKNEKPPAKAGTCSRDKFDLIVLAGGWTLCPVCDWAEGGERGPEVKDRIG